jgi:hypothetical protein
MVPRRLSSPLKLGMVLFQLARRSFTTISFINESHANARAPLCNDRTLVFSAQF